MITFQTLGGGREIGANSYILDWNGFRILLDCGAHPNKKGYESLPDIDRISSLDAIIISHAHRDHIGSLPAVHFKFPDVPIYTSKETSILVDRMYQDSEKIFNKTPPEERYFFNSLFDVRVRNSILRKTRFLKPYAPEIISKTKSENIYIQFFNAGHLFGSVGVNIYSNKFSVVYTGDICVDSAEVYKRFDYNMESADFLIIESTNGASDHNTTLAEEKLRFIEYLNKIKGAVLIPSFALGKTQYIVYLLNKLTRDGLISKRKIFVVGLGIPLTEIVREFYDKEDASLLQFNPMGFWNERYIEDAPIIIASHGMLAKHSMAATIALSILKNRDCGIIFTGYLASGTPGERLLKLKLGDRFKISHDGHDEVEINTEHIYKVSFSGHYKKSDLNRLALTFGAENIIAVHGDISALTYTKNTLEVLGKKVIIPANGETVMLAHQQEKVFISLSDMRAVITTTGISLLNGFKGQKRDDVKELKSFLNRLKPKDFKKSAAEINTLMLLNVNPDKDFVYFLSPQNEESAACAQAIAEVLCEKGIIRYFKVIQIEGITKSYKEFETKGLSNLVVRIADIISSHRNNAIINATGGFKAQIAYATIMGLLFNKDVYYMHEDFDSVIRLPSIPLSFDFRLYEFLYPTINDIINANRLAEAERIISFLPEDYRLLFSRDETLQRIALNPLGIAVNKAFIESQNADALIDRITYEDEKTFLYSGRLLSFDEMSIPEAGVIFKRLWSHSGIITGIHFGKTITEKSDELCLTYCGIKNNSLLYNLQTPLGNIEVFIKADKDYLNRLLNLLGRKIYY